MRLVFTAVVLLSYFFGYGQIDPPLISPHAVLQQRIGFTDITVDYSRPGKRGRVVMGNLVPYGRIWRVGANESTKITFSEDVKIEGHPVPKGTYALYAFPGPNEWIIVIHKNIAHWGDGRDQYNEKEDLIRFKVMPEKISDLQETFLIEFDELSHKRALMIWKWENTKVSFWIEVNTDDQMIVKINKAIRDNPSADTYYQAARYLQEEGKMQNEALSWLEKADQLTGDKYYIHRVWALVLAQVKDYKSAIVHAEKSKQLAAIENKDEFVRMNESSIQTWTDLLKNN